MIKQKKIIVCILENYFPKIGGVETLFQTLNEKLIEDGYEVHVVTSGIVGFPSYEIVHGVHVHRTFFRNRILFPIHALPLIFRVSKFADLIQTTTYAAALPSYIIKVFRRKKIILTFHEVWGQRWWTLPFMSYIERWMYWIYEKVILRLKFDAFVAVSKSTANRLEKEGIQKERIYLIYNGLSIVESQRNIWKGKLMAKNFLYVGRLGVSKGLDLLLPAFYEAYKQQPEIHLDIVVHDSLSHIARWMKAYVCSHDLENVISFIPTMTTQELQEAISIHDALIIPSRAEGFGFVAVEGGFAGIPRIVSNADSLPEVVSGKHIFVEADSISSLTRGILQAVDGKYDDTPHQDFLLDTCVKAYVSLYDSFLK